MSITSAELRKLASLNLSPEQMTGVLELLALRAEREEELERVEQERRAADAERKAVYRSRTGVTAKQWAELRDFVMNAYGGVCVYCGETDARHVDHVIPVARGGKTDISNLVPACGSCNSAKRDRPLKEWLACR